MRRVEDPLLGIPTPFRYSLQPTEIESDTQIIATLRGCPGKLIRVADGVYDNIPFQEDGEKLLAPFNQYLENRRLLKKIRSQYHIPVPDFDIIIGPGEGQQVTYYTIVDRIYGINLEYCELGPREIKHLRGYADEFFSSVAQYYWDSYKEGGWYLSDLIKDYTQFVYGKRRGEKENRMYLVDIEPRLMYLDPKNMLTHGDLFLVTFDWLYLYAKDMEYKTGSELKMFRAKLLEFANTISPIHPHYGYISSVKGELEGSTLTDSETQQSCIANMKI